MYAFLLNWSARSVEKVNVPDEDASAGTVPTKSRKGQGGKATQSRVASKNKAAEWSWKDQIVPILTLIAKIVKLKTSKIWTVSGERDTFIGCLTAPAHHVTEDEQYMKSQPIKLRVYKVICLAVKHHGHGPAAQTSIMQSLQYYEHLSEPMTGCLNVLLKEFDHAQLSKEILREIAAKSFNAEDTNGPRNSYLIGCLMRELACSEDLTSDAHQTLNGLYDLLLERTLDLSSYVRSKVLTVLSRLCDLPVKFLKQRLAITRAAVSALEDKVAGVGRNAIWLIIKLMATPPYGLMHGGLLGMEEWEDRWRRNKDTEDATDVDEEDGDKGGDSDEVDSIMDKDELESFRAVEGSESASRWTVPSSANFKKLSSTCVAHTSGLRSPNKPSTPSTRSETSRTRPVPSAAKEQVSSALPDADAMDEDLPLSAQALISTVPGSMQGALTGIAAKHSDEIGDAFKLSQLLFVVGHVAVKYIVYLELVEREWKRQKQEISEKIARGTGNDAASKDGDELDQVAGNAEDEIGDRIAPVRETELVTRRCGRWGREPSFALPHPGDVEGFEHRSSIAITLGDVAVTFSTIVDENSDELYPGLSDKDLVVKDTLTVPTHLILNGMIRAKGQLGDVSNGYCGTLISHLSVGEYATGKEEFQRTMRCMFTFIGREKQAENIVDKLCQRFRLTDDTRQWRDIVFCLSLLPFRYERSVKRLIEGLPIYRDTLHEEARSNKAANSPDSELNEFESALGERLRQCAEDQAFEKRVEVKKAAAKKRTTRRTEIFTFVGPSTQHSSMEKTGRRRRRGGIIHPTLPTHCMGPSFPALPVA
ncbi:non-SMC mitotic condensation complex subunit 1 [Lactifluus volemus]|nr:non-SMC mitotic condensation complex subunit 1 [Lactifluus volemus]